MGYLGTSDKQVKMVYIENSFSWRNSNFLTSLSIKKLTKKCGQCSNSYPRFSLNTIFSIKAMRGLLRQNLYRQNSAQCWPLLDFRKCHLLTPRSVRKFWIFKNIFEYILKKSRDTATLKKNRISSPLRLFKAGWFFL